MDASLLHKWKSKLIIPSHKEFPLKQWLFVGPSSSKLPTRFKCVLHFHLHTEYFILQWGKRKKKKGKERALVYHGGTIPIRFPRTMKIFFKKVTPNHIHTALTYLKGSMTFPGTGHLQESGHPQQQEWHGCKWAPSPYCENHLHMQGLESYLHR